MFVDIDRYVAMQRAAGLTVHVLDGAQTRAARAYASSGYPSSGPGFSDKHHTAQPMSWTDIQSILYLAGITHPDGWVMANVYPHKNDPYTITVIAAGPTYTAGKGGPLGAVPLNRGNQYGWSWECPNNGIDERWPDHLIETMTIGAAVEMEFFGWDAVVERFPAHFEWSDPGETIYAGTKRKIDLAGWCKYSVADAVYPGMWDMPRWRDDIKARHAQLYLAPLPPPVPPLTEEDDMPPTIWIDTTPGGDNAVYLVGSGGVVHLDGHLRQRFEALPGVVVIEGTNPQVSASYKRVARGL